MTDTLVEVSDKLGERLKELSAFLENQHAVDSVEETLGHLRAEVDAAMVRSRARAQQCAILLFQSSDPPSLLRFLAASADFADDIRKRDIAHTRAGVLELLAAFLESYGENRALSKQHVVAIYKACQGTARADAFNRVKAQALSVVINVLRFCDKQVSSEDIEPGEYVDKLFYDIKFSKATQTAKGQMLEVIGHLVQKFPEDVKGLVPPLLSWIEGELQKQFASNSPEMLLVNGLLFALARLLECEPERYIHNEGMRKKVYSYLLTVFATSVSGNLSRYHVTRSSEILLAEHAVTFWQEIGPSGYDWFTYMKFCCTSENKTIKTHVFECSNAILKALNTYLLEAQDDTRKKCLNRILKEVLPVLNDATADPSAVSYAILCLGWLARPINNYLGPKGYCKIEEKLKTFGENLLAMDAKYAAVRWAVCSQYIQCIGHFVREGPKFPLDDGYVNFLGDLLCHLMNVYPHCLWRAKVMIYKSVILVFDSSRKRTIVGPLVDRFIHHTLLLSISNVTRSDQAIAIYHPETGEQETKLLYDFEEFWLVLLRRTNYIVESIQSMAQFGDDDVDMDDAKDSERSLQTVLFDSVVKHMLGIIDQLNLSYSYDLQTTNNGKNASGYMPVIPRDHSILLNLTEFVERVVAKLPRSLLRPWISQLLRKMFSLATKLPLVSSFYRIGSVLATTIDDLELFEGKCLDGEGCRLRDDFTLFVTKVCAQARFYQDELLVASAQFVLASPTKQAPIDITSGILKASLVLGRSYLPAANIAITSMERWQLQSPEKLQHIIREVVPFLSAYLEQADIHDDDVETALTSSTVGASDVANLQRRILLLLGKCGGRASLAMSQPPSASGCSTGNTASPYFQLKLDLSEMSPSLSVDLILEHLGELASDSTVRRVKASASEGYHALICYLCGKTTTHPHTAGKKTVFYNLWRSIFTRSMRLATDPEKICRSLFEPLLFQLLHWLGTSSATFPFEYAGMLEEFISSLSDPDNAAVRALSARCIASLLTQALESQAPRDKADDIFGRLFSLCRHPGAIQRSGAAAAISVFLRSVNEEDGAVLTRFALPCVKNLLYALRLCDNDIRSGVGGVDVSRDVISRAVTKIERGISRFPQLFLNKGSSKRQGSCAGDDNILQETTIWLFRQASRRETLFRRLCRRLFVSFSAVISGTSSQWIVKYAASLHSGSITTVLAPLNSLACTLPLDAESMINWMKQISASIESYCWCVEVLGDKADAVFELDRQGSSKRKFSEYLSDPTEHRPQQVLSWSIANFVNQKDPWDNEEVMAVSMAMRTQWIEAYLSTLASLCSNIKSSLDCNSSLHHSVADFHEQPFRAAFVTKLLKCLLHRPNAWSNGRELFDDIECSCSKFAKASSDWAHELHQSAEILLQPLLLCVTDVQDESTFVKHAKTIKTLSTFGITILSAGIISVQEARKFAEVFASASRKAMEYGRSLPDNHAIAVSALQAAAACGWGITDVFVGDLRKVYGPVYTDIIHFIPTLVVWKECANQMVMLSLTNDNMVGILANVLRQVTEFKVYKAGSAGWDAFVETLVANIKQYVTSLEVVKEDTQRTRILLQVLGLFLELCQHCSRNLVEALNIGPISDIRNAIVDMLKTRCSYLVKADILRMLSLMGPSCRLAADGDRASKLVLNAMVAFFYDEFPILSTDVTRGSKDFDVFHVLFSELLALIERSKSISYLRIIYPSLKEGDTHLFNTEIKQMLARLSSSLGSKPDGTVTQDASLSTLEEIFELLLDSTLDTTIRKTLLDDVFTPAIEFQTGETLQQFYLTKCPSKKATIIGVLATLISTSSEATSGGNRFAVFVAFSLVEILYRLVDPEFIRNDINAGFLGHKNGKGREFTMLVCKCASKVITKFYGEVDESTRVTCCAAYNCLLTAVSRTQKQEKFFDQILFQPALWVNIVDTSRQCEMCAETKEFASIPLSTFSASSLQSRQNTESAASKTKNASSVLQFFTVSSLSMDGDVSRYSAMSAPAGIDETCATYDNVTIELDEINQHPCMVSLLRVLMQMKADFGSNWNEAAMPGWMKKIFDVMVDSSIELNVRLFLTKVVMNIPDVFVLYASSFLPTVMEILLETTSFQSDPEFHYLLRDCCNLVLDRWSNVSGTSISSVSSQFINKLVTLCPYHSNWIRDSNVTSVIRLIEHWKDAVNVDVGLLADFLHNQDEDVKMQSAKQFTALQVISTMLSEGMVSDLQSDDDEQRLQDGILLTMQNKKAALYLVAAEVGGLYLKSTDREAFKHKLTELIISAYNDEDFGRFLALLRNSSMHQPEIIDAMMLHRLSFVLPKVVSVDAWSVLAAEAVANAATNGEVVGVVFTHVQAVFGRFIAHRHAGVQYSTLQAVSNLVDHLSTIDLERLANNVSDDGLGLFEYFESHDLSMCRELLFAIATKLHERDLATLTKKRIRRSLLNSITDSDEQLRHKALTYWNASDIAQDTCSDRLAAIFDDLYFPELADKWVLYATNLLVGMVKKGPQFDQPLFPSALGNGEYTEASIDASWEAKTQSMAPLFSVEAETFRSQWKPSQQSSSLTPTQTDTLLGSMQSQLFTSRSALQSQLPSGPQAPSTSQYRAGSRRFVKRNTPIDALHTKKATQRHFQNQYAALKKQEEARVNRERNERHGQVSMKRKYRKGDYPDINISQRDIIEPIMALCDTHAPTSELVFSALFSSLAVCPAFEQSDYPGQLAEKIERSLQLSKTSSTYVGCIESAYLGSLIKNAKLCETMPISLSALGEAGLSCGQYHLSELVLDERLIYNSQHGLDDPSLPSEDGWDLLQKLLSTIKKQNFLVALSMARSTTEESKIALQAQLSGDLTLAIASYKKAEGILNAQLEDLNGSDILATQASRCCWQRLDCLETLNNWDTLHQELTDAVGTDNDHFWSPSAPYLEQGVGHYLRSCLGMIAADHFSETISLTNLQVFVENAVKDTLKRQFMQSRFPVEVCLMYLSMGDTNHARVCVENFYANFLKEWRRTNTIETSSRLELMQSLSSMVEIDEILKLLRNDRHETRQSKHGGHSMTVFVNEWGSRTPSAGEAGIAIWSQYYMVQNYVAKCLLGYGQDHGTMVEDNDRLAILERKSHVMLDYAAAAISCNILSLGSKMLKSYRELCNANNLPKVSTHMIEVFVSHVLKLVDRQVHQSGSSGPSSSSIKLTTKYYETATKMFDNVEIMNMLETADSSDCVTMGYLEAKTFASAAAFYALNDLNDSLKEEYFQRAIDMFQVSCKRIDSANEATSGNAGGYLSPAFLRCRLTFIEFLVDLLFKCEFAKLADISDRKTLTKLLVDNVLGGMTSGDRECANYFPQLCDMIAPYPDIVEHFEQQILATLPLWTCLSWSAQLMALLNGPIGKTIVAILEKMAAKYPAALFYDFKVTCGASQDAFKVDLRRLEALLANPVMEKFVTALRLIHHPEIRLKEGLREIAKLLETNRTADARQKLKVLWEDCFSPDHPLLGSQIGRYNRDWSRKAKRDVERILGKDGAKMTTKTVNSAREWIMNHFSVTPGKYGIMKDMKARLGDFAEWLEEFDHSSCILELPGQYTSYWGKPDPSTHTRILSFDSMLGVLASKQLPKRLTVHGSDEQDYTFLVKGGEDLRLDQRIEQLFGVMNQILQVDSRCHDQGLEIKTYNVIPMTQEIGILEWINGTSTLKGVIESQLQVDERCTDLKNNKRQKLELFNTTAAKAYEVFLLKQRGSSFSAKVIAPRSTDVVEHYAKVQAMIPADLLRRQLLGMGLHFDEFLSIRDNFLKSLATFSACSYVLGIGDRHLDNFLLDLSNGRIIGIDFGVSFGAGASVLPVPELIPFRFTRQMDFVLQPYDGSNLMAQDMQSVFEALRAKRQVVESVMNVFLHEPLLDWQQSTTTHQKGIFDGGAATLEDTDVEMEDVENSSRSRQKSIASASGGEGATAWLPDVKIAIARRKLEGVSPGLLLKEELCQNAHLKQHIEKFTTLIDSVCSNNDMTAMNSLTQAQELLTMATSPDLLGRTFQGWMPWL